MHPARHIKIVAKCMPQCKKENTDESAFLRAQWK